MAAFDSFTGGFKYISTENPTSVLAFYLPLKLMVTSARQSVSKARASMLY